MCFESIKNSVYRVKLWEDRVVTFDNRNWTSHITWEDASLEHALTSCQEKGGQMPFHDLTNSEELLKEHEMHDKLWDWFLDDK